MSAAPLILSRLQACAIQSRLQLVPETSTRSRPVPAQEAPVGPRLQARPRHAAAELAFYRKYTEGMLRRYVSLSMESGRIPSLMGREILPGSASTYAIHSFEDNIIFLCDVEACMKKLNVSEQWLIRRIALQQYTQEEAARMLQYPRRTVMRKYHEAMNRLTGILLDAKLLEPFSCS